MAKWVAIGLGIAGVAAIVVKELPAMKRELKIVKM